MNVRTLRTDKNWSQEQLAHFSGLSIRTIQRIENNEKVALESLKSLAAVFEISLTELRQEQTMTAANLNVPDTENSKQILTEEQGKKIKQQVAEIKNFYKMLMIYLASFLIWPFIALVDERPDNDAWFVTLYMGCLYLVIIAIHANSAFRPFGDKWQKKQQRKLIDE
jgi:transcriptional regulator with XRE-family HTH domain